MPEEDVVVDQAVEAQAEETAAEPHGEVTLEDRLAALESELAREKQERTRIESQFGEARQAAEFYRGLAYQQQMAQQPQETGPSPDDYADIRTVDQIVQQKVAAVEQQLQAERVARMEAEARQTYPDWDQVLAVTLEMAQKNRGLAASIWNSEDPTKMAYMIGKAAMMDRAPGANNVVSRAQKNATVTKTLSSVSGQAAPTRKNWRQATDEEILARAKRIVEGGGA